MAGKLAFPLALAIVAAVSCAQADILKHVDAPETGEHKIRQQCFAHYVLERSILKVRGELIEQELRNDLAEIKQHLAKEHSEGSFDARNCYTSALACSRIGDQQYPNLEQFSSEKFLQKACQRWVKFEQLCELIKARTSGDRQLLAVEQWVCQVGADSKFQLESDPVFSLTRKSCGVNNWQLGNREAEEQFYKVSLFTEEELEREKSILAREMAADNEMRATAPAKIAQEASQLIRERIRNHFGEFSKCWANNDAQLAIEAQRKLKESELVQPKEEDEEKRKGFLGKVFGQCTGGSCS